MKLSDHQTVTPYLMVHSARSFIDFVEHVFRSQAEMGKTTGLAEDSERLVHAEVRIGGSTLFFADSGPDGGRCLPAYQPGEDPARIQMWAEVPDAEDAYARAVAAGAAPVMAPAGGNRMGGFVDPFGTLWWVNTSA